MITKDNIEEAYCFLHQKWRVYAHSTSSTQRDDIEYAISDYLTSMDKELYNYISDGAEGFLKEHGHFATDMEQAVNKLETMTTGQ